MKRCRLLSLVFVLTLVSFSAYSQYDSSYISSYRTYLVGRFLLNRKFTGLNVSDDINGYSVRYRPNKTLSAGFGVTYKFVTLNLTTGIIQPNEKKGETRNLDFQLHRYGRKFVTDLLLQFYKGFYVPDGRYALPDEFYLRPDLAVNAIGLGHQYVVNNRKFSYRAAFQQSEIQKKSAGSLLFGVQLFMGRFKADSTVIPRRAMSDASGETIYKMRFLQFGPNAGYIYTCVYRNFFFTAGGSVSLNIGLNRAFDSNEIITFTSISPNTAVRLSTGYNAKLWSINFVYISTDLHLPDFKTRSILVNSGNIRMNLVYRFHVKKNTKKMLRAIDKVDDKLNGS